MSSQPEEGKEKCPYGPTTGYTGLIVGKALLPSSSLWSMDLNTAAVRGFPAGPLCMDVDVGLLPIAQSTELTTTLPSEQGSLGSSPHSGTPLANSLPIERDASPLLAQE